MSLEEFIFSRIENATPEIIQSIMAQFPNLNLSLKQLTSKINHLKKRKDKFRNDRNLDLELHRLFHDQIPLPQIAECLKRQGYQISKKTIKRRKLLFLNEDQ